MTLAGDDPLNAKDGGRRERYADKKIRPEGVWQTRAAESCLVPRFLDGEIDGKDRSLVGVYISRGGGYGGRPKERKREGEGRKRGSSMCMRVCVSVCGCARKRKREGGKERIRKRRREKGDGSQSLEGL